MDSLAQSFEPTVLHHMRITRYTADLNPSARSDTFYELVELVVGTISHITLEPSWLLYSELLSEIFLLNATLVFQLSH